MTYPNPDKQSRIWHSQIAGSEGLLRSGSLYEAGNEGFCTSHTRRLWSWWDMLQNAWFFILTLLQLEALENEIVRGYPNPDQALSETSLRELASRLRNHWDQCAQLEYRSSINILRTIFGDQWQPPVVGQQRPPLALHMSSAREAISRIKQLIEQFRLDAFEAFLLPLRKDVVLHYYERTFGAEIDDAFPSAAIEVKEAGTCFALERYTGSVFHLMRGAEYGMRSLAQTLRPAAVQAIPLEYQLWHNVIEQIDSDYKALVNQWKNPSKANALAFFTGAVSELSAFKDEVRNVLMHTRSGLYDEPRAVSVRNRVREFFVRLTAKGVREDGAGGALDAAKFVTP